MYSAHRDDVKVKPHLRVSVVEQSGCATSVVSCRPGIAQLSWRVNLARKRQLLNGATSNLRFSALHLSSFCIHDHSAGMDNEAVSPIVAPQRNGSAVNLADPPSYADPSRNLAVGPSRGDESAQKAVDEVLYSDVRDDSSTATCPTVADMTRLGSTHFSQGCGRALHRRM